MIMRVDKILQNISTAAQTKASDMIINPTQTLFQQKLNIIVLIKAGLTAGLLHEF